MSVQNTIPHFTFAAAYGAGKFSVLPVFASVCLSVCICVQLWTQRNAERFAYICKDKMQNQMMSLHNAKKIIISKKKYFIFKDGKYVFM